MDRALAALLVVAACGGSTARVPTEIPMKRGIVAHRGASQEAPENTLAALRLGWSLGAESCEIDVRVTRDGAVVVMHDDTTARTGGLDRAVADQTLDELLALDVGAWKGERWRGERIPTLGEALAIVPAGRMLFVEIKSGADTAAVIAAAIRDAAPAPGAVALQGYDADALAAVGVLLPGIPTYWDVDPPYRPSVIDDAVARGFTGLALDHRGVDDAMVAAIAAAHLSLDVWTVDDASSIATWLARGARYVETNRP